MTAGGASPSRRRAVWAALALILALAAQLRFGAALHTAVDRPVRADAADYLAYAMNLREHGVYSRRPPGESAEAPAPDGLRAPGYPVFLAAVMDDPPTARTLVRVALLQAAIGVLVTGLGFVLARRFMPAAWALGVALLTALSPHLVNAGVYLLTETLFSLAVLLALLALAARDLAQRPRALLAAGALIGVACLVRPTLTYFPVLLCGLFLLRWPPRRALRAGALTVAGFLAVTGPWALRNASLPGGADPTLQINMLHHGLYPDFTYEGDPASYGYPYRADPRSPEISASTGAALGEIARRFREEPARHLRWFLVGKPLALWSWEDPQSAGGSFVYPVLRSPYLEPGLPRASETAMRALQPALVLAGALFCLAVWLPAVQRRLPAAAVFPAQACALMLMYLTALHMAGLPLARYATPFRPELYAVACAGLALVFGALRRRPPETP